MWNKVKYGVGNYMRGQTEVLILATRGAVPVLSQDERGYLEEPRAGHSEKPEAFAKLVERVSPGPRIELFARTPRKDWERWGLEAQKEAANA